MKSSPKTIQDILIESPGPKTRRTITFITVISLLALVVLVFFIIRQFYTTGQLSARYWSFFKKATTWRFLAEGLAGTLAASFVAGVITFVLGFAMMTGRICRFKPLQVLSSCLIEFTRGVPTLLFIYFFFLVVPQFGIKLSPIWKISLPVAISASGTVAESLRSGINAVPKGQREAALSLGLRDTAVFLRIILPQGLRFVIPAMISEMIIVVKDTTFAYIVTYPDLMQNARVLISNYDSMLSVYILVAVIYILINFGLNKLANLVRLKSRKA